ncbi:DUF4440 domain-containing protein [Nocardia arthritidis]|uniref:DUF4440 domain-containing protein n=1 Tax=Nocardia arthritidis TaxID=228602 RepID=UPI0007A453EB|nr:DUF4440 domain-containing protein [Nocardia arthritidis]
MFSHDHAHADGASKSGVEAVQTFLRRYDDSVSASDFDTLPSFFDPQILIVTPTTSRCVTREEFIAAARARARGIAAGHALLAAQSTIELGGHYWLTSAHWTMTLDDAPALDLYSDFLVRRSDGELSIAAYLTRQDLPQLVRDISRAD